jgi:Flp pilus assembly protein TadD
MLQGVHVIRLLSLSLAVLAVAAACDSPDPVALKADAIRRGDDLVRQKRYVEAASAYQIAVRHDPKDADLRMKLAAVHKITNRWDEFASEATIAADLQPGNRDAQMEAVTGLIGQSAFGVGHMS